MLTNRTLPLLAGFALAVLPLSAATLNIQLENLSPEHGAWLTPVWVGFHDGGFDTYNDGQQASMAVERYAEDGDGSHLGSSFAAYAGGQVQATLIADQGIPPLAPGETASIQLEVDGMVPSGRYLSFFAMLLPSNDAFLGNHEPMAFPVFNVSGQFVGLDAIIGGGHVRDAGTEVNDELPAHTAFFGQATPDTGVSENGVVGLHGGFLPTGSNGILDDPMFAMADFTQPSYPLLHITVSMEQTTDAQDRPTAFQLEAAYPNPFNPSTTLQFTLAETAPARLSVYNLTGERVATLVDGLVAGGEHRVVFDASRLTSGIYLAALESGGRTQTEKLVLVK